MVSEAIDKIEQQRKKWEDFVNKGNVEGYVSFIDEDAVWVSQNLLPVVSRQAIKEWIEPFFRQFDYEFRTSDHQIQCSGGWACEQAQFSSKIIPKNGSEPMFHEGQYILLWRENAKGVWMMNRYIVVANMEMEG